MRHIITESKVEDVALKVLSFQNPRTLPFKGLADAQKNTKEAIELYIESFWVEDS